MTKEEILQIVRKAVYRHVGPEYNREALIEEVSKDLDKLISDNDLSKF